MKTKYSVTKSWWTEENPKTFEVTEHESIILGEYNNEKDALNHLKKLDQDCHYIEKEVYMPVEGYPGYYQWETEEGYECKYLYQFKEELTKIDNPNN